MPEGPSIILVKEAAAIFAGEKNIAVSGNSKIDQNVLLNKKIVEFKSYGKHFLICLNGLTLRVHYINQHYDWSADVMNDQWNKKKAKVKLKAIADKLICDALLEQKQTGLKKRRSFICANCQVLYN